MSRFAIPKGRDYTFRVTVLKDNSFLTQDLSNMDEDNSEFHLLTVNSDGATKVSEESDDITITRVADNITSNYLRLVNDTADTADSGEESYLTLDEAQKVADIKNGVNTVDTSIVNVIDDSDNNGIVSTDTVAIKVVLPATIEEGTEVSIGKDSDNTVTKTVTNTNKSYGFILIDDVPLGDDETTTILNFTMSIDNTTTTMQDIVLYRDDDWDTTVKLVPKVLNIHHDDLKYLNGKLSITLSANYTDKLVPKFGPAVDNYYGLPSYQATLLVKFTDDNIPDKFVKIDKVYVLPTGE